MDDGDPDLVLQLDRIREVLEQRGREERDLVGQEAPIGGVFRPGNALVEPVEPVSGTQPGLASLNGRRLILDDDGHLVEGAHERLRDGVQGALNECVEAVEGSGGVTAAGTAPGSLGHAPMLRPDSDPRPRPATATRDRDPRPGEPHGVGCGSKEPFIADR